MSEFQFRFEWEESPRVRAAELDATWARLEINAHGEAVTRVESRRVQSVRTGIYVPLFPIAEWMVANWWFLWEEWRGDARGPRHCLLAAREGFALPDIRFLPTETKMEVIWQPTGSNQAGTSSTELWFLSGGSRVIAKALVKQEFRRLVEAVIERLRSRQVEFSRLAEEWNAILATEDNPEQKAFCEKAARLGCDPFDVSEAVAAQIEEADTLLPEPVVEDFCDAIPLAQLSSGARTVRWFIDRAVGSPPSAGRWQEFRKNLRWSQTGVAWQDGYHQAQAVRADLGWEGAIKSALESFLLREFGSLQIDDFAGVARVDAVSVPTSSGAPLFGIPPQLLAENRRFSLCRALSDYLASERPSLVTRGQTEHQQRNRAFAAEFLAPADSIRKWIDGRPVAEEDIEELAREFQVSEKVIRHQIQNHDLASLGA